VTGAAVLPPFVAACLLLVVAGCFKLRDPQAARGALEQLGLPAPVFAVRALGLCEVALGVLAGWRPETLTAALVAGAYGVFCLTTVRLLMVEGGVDCGCFGAASTVASRAHAATCAAACGVAVLAALFPPGGVSWLVTRTPLIAVTVTLGTITAAFAAYAVFTLFTPAWRAYGSGEPQ
jgi:uncharacterized protein YjeT (DUF2065 family)